VDVIIDAADLVEDPAFGADDPADDSVETLGDVGGDPG
jgi:hypothetical protein